MIIIYVQNLIYVQKKILIYVQKSSYTRRHAISKLLSHVRIIYIFSKFFIVLVYEDFNEAYM